jgi:hypothetical protein
MSMSVAGAVSCRNKKARVVAAKLDGLRKSTILGCPVFDSVIE